MTDQFQRRNFRVAMGNKLRADAILDILDGVEQRVQVTLTSAQARGLHGTPVTIVPAPGVGYFVVPKRVVVKMTFLANVYNSVGGGDDFVLRYTDASGAIVTQIETVGFLDQSTDQVRVGFPSAGTTAKTEITPVANAPIVANILGTELAALNLASNGDSPIIITCTYVTIPY